jgi:hypothetical protein
MEQESWSKTLKKTVKNEILDLLFFDEEKYKSKTHICPKKMINLLQNREHQYKNNT